MKKTMNHVLKGFCTILSATMLFMATGCDKIGDLIDEIDPIWPPKIDESEKVNLINILEMTLPQVNLTILKVWKL